MTSGMQAHRGTGGPSPGKDKNVLKATSNGSSSSKKKRYLLEKKEIEIVRRAGARQEILDITDKGEKNSMG